MAWLTSEAALKALGTKPQSLYASVSRGRIRARPDPHDPRRSLYDADDVERLARRSAGRRKAEAVAADAIRWGDPVLPSAISTIIEGRLYYRGHDVVALAEAATLEDVAGLLWQAPGADFGLPAAGHPEAVLEIIPLRRAFAAIADRAAADRPALGRPLTELRGEAAGIVATLARALGAVASSAPLHRRFAAAWRRPEAAQLLRQALVLLADHELNASTFAARITASTGASLAAAVLSGLATLTGPLHGNAYLAIRALAAASARDGTAATARAWQAGGRALPGFGHRLYPDGDPRAQALLALFPLPPTYAALASLGRELTGEPPNVDFALTALASAFDLPEDAPFTLFAVARSTGWLAHALEQIGTGTLIRPRANYIGVPPSA
ncbi:MAG: citrate synthase [Devosia sp.]|nr:citrate synthase [Devosia sp.]